MTTAPSAARRRPWRERRIRPRRPDVAVLNQAPLAQLHIYESLVLLTRRDGASWRQYPVSPDEIAQLLGRLPVASGMLPPHTLGTGMIQGAPFYVVYIPARRARIQTTARLYDIPLPPLIWCGHKHEYRIWALATPDEPARDVPLCKAPFPNCYDDGRICWGNVAQIPLATPKALDSVLKLFLEESAFNAHVAGGKSVGFPVNVIARWNDLVATEAEAYPLDDLMPAECSLAWALSGNWGGRRR
jgi:PRTRC genetic system protein B